MTGDATPCHVSAGGVEFDCRSCGACCHGRSGTVLVTADDLVQWKRAGRGDLEGALVPGHFGLDGLGVRETGACVHLGTAQNPLDCSIYELRPETCRAFPVGGPECLSARRHGTR